MSEWRDEVWKPVIGWSGLYEVSSLGRVRSVDRQISRRGQTPVRCEGRMLRQKLSNKGYPVVKLRNGNVGFSKTVSVHRTVADAFVPNPMGKPNVNHIDNTKTNNRPANLQWCTQAENLEHMTRQGRRAPPFYAGKRSPNASLSDEEVCLARAAYSRGEETWETIGAKLGVSKRAAGRLINRETYCNV